MSDQGITDDQLLSTTDGVLTSISDIQSISNGGGLSTTNGKSQVDKEEEKLSQPDGVPGDTPEAMDKVYDNVDMSDDKIEQQFQNETLGKGNKIN